MPTVAKVASIPLAVALLALAAPSARADCPLPPHFLFATESSSNVTLCDSSDSCPSASAILRQDIATGELVQLGHFCDASSCFVDECVPAGSYRYGYAVPLTCTGSSRCAGSVQYFTTATVSAPLGSCTRSASDPAPTAYASPAPWGSGATQYLACDSSSGCAAAGGGLATNVAALDLGAVALALLWLRKRRRA